MCKKCVKLINIITTSKLCISFVAVFVFTLFSQITIKSQNIRAFEIGGMMGSSYYMGDMNLSQHFYSSHLAVGGFAKYHINTRVIVRFGAFHSKLSARDSDFQNKYQQFRDHEFETPLTELSAQVEFNFMRFIIGQTGRNAFTPYLQTGLVAYLANESEVGGGFALPIGIGVKANIAPRITIGAEWAFRRTFTDLLDNLAGEDIGRYDTGLSAPANEKNDFKQQAFRFKNDWYVYGAVTLTYSFRIGGLGCPAYYDR